MVERATYRGVERDSMELFTEHLERGQWEARHSEPSNSALARGEWRNARNLSLQRMWMESGDFGWDVLAVEAAPRCRWLAP